MQRRSWAATLLLVVCVVAEGCHEEDRTGPDRQDVIPTSLVANPTAEMAFSSTRDGNSELYVMNADGSGQTRLTDNADPDGTPNWSPDGTKLAFVSQRDGNDEIYVMSANGSDRTNLSNNPGFDGYPTWSPDGTKLAFVSNRGGGDVYVMNADGTGVTNLTNTGGVDDPAWSPDGTRLTFRSFRHGAPEIYVMDADGSDQIRLTNNPATDTDTDWSPDGTKIAFSSTRDGNHEIYVMNANGSDPTRLTNDPAVDRDPAWSPDGAKLAWMAERDGNREIYVMNADGTGPVNITNNLGDDLEPDWRPVVIPPCTPPAITAQPAGATRTVGESVTFSVTATGNVSGYQWRKNTADITGATGASFTIPSVQLGDAGSYNVVLTSACGSDASASAVLVVKSNQTISFAAIPDKIVGSPPFALVATASSGLPVSLSIVSGPATISSNTVTLTGIGPVVVRASQPGDPSYNPAEEVVRSFAVVYPFAGFLQPVDNSPVVNKTTSGQAIPVKFSLGGDRGLDIFQPGSPTSGSYACTASPEDVLEQTETASSSGLTYDAAAGQYKYTWKTEKAWANSCRKLVLKLKDGTSREALFHLTK
jgi:Tol biopolymer transport system component